MKKSMAERKTGTKFKITGLENEKATGSDLPLERNWKNGTPTRTRTLKRVATLANKGYNL